jgi:hypothetical protein
MVNVPSVGGPRGIFEIFAPGLFLLLNIVGGIYLVPFTDEATKKQLASVAASPALAVFVVVSFGYLAGVVLRILRSEVPDRASKKFLQLYDGNARGGEREDSETDIGNSYAYADFPYHRWLETVVRRRFPQDVNAFFTAVWKGKSSKQFLNFCKVVLSVSDPLAAVEIYAAESLSRYISGMFYALGTALLIAAVVTCSRIAVGARLGAAVPVAAGAYIVGLIAILANFRFIRIKEVETIFAAAFKNRHLFEVTNGDITSALRQNVQQPAAGGPPASAAAG